jgi:hypothetical protein
MIKCIRNLFYLFIFLLLFGSCANVYKHPSLKAFEARHKTMAFLPFTVSYSYYKRPKRLSTQAQKELEQIQAEKMLQEMYGFFKQHSQRNSTITFQPPSITDSLLKAAGIDRHNIQLYKEDELTKILGVDGLFKMKVSTYFFREEVEALAIMILSIFSLATQEIAIDATIHDGRSNELVWRYQRTFKGGLLDSERKKRKIVKRKIKRRFPYRF